MNGTWLLMTNILPEHCFFFIEKSNPSSSRCFKDVFSMFQLLKFKIYSNFLSLTPIFCKVSIEKYRKTPNFFLTGIIFTPILKILVRILRMLDQTKNINETSWVRWLWLLGQTEKVILTFNRLTLMWLVTWIQSCPPLTGTWWYYTTSGWTI